MKYFAFAAAALLVASPALAQRQHRVMAGGDPDLDLSVRPSDRARPVEVDRDDDVYLPGLTERAGVESAADMARFKGEGGPLDDTGYPPCSPTVKDRCIELDNRAG
jgi:hypothetical protein